jgi:hypothetical protein
LIFVGAVRWRRKSGLRSLRVKSISIRERRGKTPIWFIKVIVPGGLE